MAAQQKQNEVGAPIPQYFSKLYLKLLLAKKDFAKAQTFLETEGKRSFELWLDQRAWQVQILFQSGQLEKTCQELTEIIRFNYTQVKQDFQSIYNLHELLITLAVKICDVDSSFDFLANTLPNASPASLFPDFSPNTEYLVNLYGSFRHYANHDATDKSVNGQNCRKSALLSMLLLKHKLISLKGPKTLDRQQKSVLFEPLVAEYCA